MYASVPKQRILILGGGFAGVATARRLETLLRSRPDVEIVLVSAENFVLMTPLLFEVFSGTLDLRDCSLPIRAFLRRTRFVEATVAGIDLDRRIVRVVRAGQRSELQYDQLVLALGSKTNRQMIPGSEHAFTFKSLADALVLRNYVIERFERADAEPDPQRRAQLLTFVIIGGGLVGVELLGELTTFVDGIRHFYRNVSRREVRFVLLQAGDRIMPEVDPTLAAYGVQVLAQRPGVELRTDAPVRAIEPGKVHLTHETIAADTIVLAAGAVPSPIIVGLPVEKSPRGHIVVKPTMRSPSHPEVWAIGDCASIPGPDGNPYPSLAQHAMREARVLARNIFDALNGRPPEPFVYRTLGIMGSLGHSKGFGRLFKMHVYGFPAWFIRRTYYMLQMPGWSRRLRILIDWTFAVLFRPEAVKVDLDSETALMLRELTLRVAEASHVEQKKDASQPLSGGPAPPVYLEAETALA